MKLLKTTRSSCSTRHAKQEEYNANTPVYKQTKNQKKSQDYTTRRDIPYQSGDQISIQNKLHLIQLL